VSIEFRKSTTDQGDQLDGQFVFPTSFGQRRLWFLDELNAASGTAYVVHGVIRMEGPLDPRILQKAVDSIIARHESLRTRFAVVDGEPVQVITPELTLPIPTTDLSNLDEPNRETEVHRLAQREVRRRFDLTTAPLLRVTLLHLDHNHHVLLVTLHHIISDGWSGSIFVNELAAHYHAHTTNTPPDLPDLPIQYPDYAVWQNHQTTDDQLHYWQTQLADLPTLTLPTDHPRPPIQTFHGSTRTTDLPTWLTQRLDHLAHANNATLYMTTLAAFQLLLARLTGQDDFAIGTPIAGRTRPELENLIGFFLNNLVLRARLSEQDSFVDLVRRVRDTCLDAYAHQDVPFERIVEDLQPARDLSRSPLFQVMFVLRNEPMPVLEFPGMRLTPLTPDPGASKFDLTMILTPHEGGLRVELEYAAGLFEPETIDLLLERYRLLLKAIVTDPSAPLDQLSVIGAQEQDELDAFARGPMASSSQECLPDLIEAQARTTPDAIAIVQGDAQLSYRDLNSRANQLAAELRTRGIGPEKLVGVCLDRRPDLIVALLAVLKTGGAYLPLDPAYPGDRIAYMIADSGARLLITDDQRTMPDIDILDVTRERDRIAAHDSADLPHGAGPENLAYVIYTSGSTGRPKGVMVTHAGVVNFLRAMLAEPGMTAGDTLAAVTTFSFDIAGLEFYLPLIAGGRVVLVSHDEASDGERLAEILRGCAATVLQATPTTWQLLLDAGWTAPPGFRALCGGEALPPDLAERMIAAGATVCNLYGPTETTIWSSRHRLEEADKSRPVPLGRPIEQTLMYVLDDQLRQLPLGVPGELCIAGRGVARGYLRRPGLTAERFVPDPFGHPGTRMYRTGDLVRLRRDGVMDFLGRIDNQVKVRGFRIELGEIESALREHDSVREAVVVAREDQPGDKRLVAYVTSGSADGLEPQLRDTLAGRLPDYMIPATFVFLDSLPHTPNGKIDRKALPAPEGDRPQLATEYVAPESPVQRQIADMFARSLGIDQVGLRDDFFELGGHSLLAARLLAELRDEFHVELQLQSLFFKPTVENIASIVERYRQAPRTGEQDVADLVEGLSDEEVEALLNDPMIAAAPEEDGR
jgi:amino acid adenylation domain-containing protein